MAFQLNRKPQAPSQPLATRGQADQVPSTASRTTHHNGVAQPFLSSGDVTSTP